DRRGGDEVGAGAVACDVDGDGVAHFGELGVFFAFGVEGEEVAAFYVEGALAFFGDAGEFDARPDFVGGFVVHAQVERGPDPEGNPVAVGRGADVFGVLPGCRGFVARQQRDDVGYFVGRAVVDGLGAGRGRVGLELDRLVADVDRVGF